MKYKEIITKKGTGNIEFLNEKKIMIVRAEKKIRPNEKCPCGSGKKYKNCCG